MKKENTYFGELSVSMKDREFLKDSMSYMYSPEIWSACLSFADQLAFDEHKKAIELKLKENKIGPQNTDSRLSIL